MKRLSTFTSAFLFVCFFAVTALLQQSCYPKFNPNAPKKDIYVVYGVLHADDSVQYVRVMKAFLVDGDAIEFAKNNDLSVKGLKVELMGNNKTLSATQIDNVPLKNSGDFYPFTTLYRLETKGTNAIKEGLKYDLKITDPNNPDFKLEAYTYVPLSFRLNKPDYFGTTSPPNPMVQLPVVDLDKVYRVAWQNKANSRTRAFEVRAYLYCQKNGVPDTISYTSSLVIKDEGRGCVASGTEMCFEFSEKELLRAFKTKMPETPGLSYTYLTTPKIATTKEALPKSVHLQITAIDSFMTNYLRVNNPVVTDLNGVKPEYTNLKGTQEVYGIFGSTITNNYIDKNSGYFLLGNCSEYLLGLNGTPKPESPCSLD